MSDKNVPEGRRIEIKEILNSDLIQAKRIDGQLEIRFPFDVPGVKTSEEMLWMGLVVLANEIEQLKDVAFSNSNPLSFRRNEGLKCYEVFCRKSNKEVDRISVHEGDMKVVLFASKYRIAPEEVAAVLRNNE